MPNYTTTSSTFNTFAVFLSTSDYNALTTGTPGVIYTDQQSAGQPQKRWDPVGLTFVSVGGGTSPITVTGGSGVGSVLTATIGSGWVNNGGNWTRNGVNISGATGLTYTSVSADFGTYVSFASTNIPFIPTGVFVGLTVPTFNVQPSAQSVVAPAAATFSVVAAGGGTLTYQWLKSGTSIVGATSANYTTPATSTADSGTTFACTVTNSAGSVTSSAASLTVAPAVVAPSITTQPTAQSVTAPAAATFTVAATGSTLAYQWRKGGVAISGATVASYTTPATSTSDNGSSFDCVISNSAGTVTSSAVGLTFAAAGSVTVPTITTQLVAQSVTAPATATFTLAASANGGTLAYQWRRGGVAINGATGSSYTTAATTTADSGASFDCVVSNSAGSVTSSAVALTVAASGALDTRPGWFAAPSTAATTGTAAFITGRTILANGANGGKTGTGTVTTAGSNYAWFAVANASPPSFLGGGFSGGFTLTGNPFVDTNGTTWYLYESDYPASYSNTAITLS